MRDKFFLPLISIMFGVLTTLSWGQTNEVPAELGVSSYTNYYGWEYVGATPAQTYMGDGSFLSHKGISLLAWTPEATNNISQVQNWEFHIDDIEAFNQLSYEEQQEFLADTNNVSLLISTNSYTASPPTVWEYRSTQYEYLNTQFDIDTKLRLLTKGYTNSQASSVFKLTVSADNVINDENGGYVMSVPIDSSEIQILGETPNSNGVIYKVLQDNSTNDVTPVINTATYSNYTFALTVERVRVSIVIRNSGEITPLTSSNGVSGPGHYVWLTNWFGQTQLGPGPTPGPTSGMHVANLIELYSTVPNDTNFSQGLTWHRDAEGRRYHWEPGWTSTTNGGSIDFITTGIPTGGGSDDPAANNSASTDELPDSYWNIYDHDAPSLRLADSIYSSLPENSVAALRFNAREWITWNGAIISDIVSWHSRVTLKKVTVYVTSPPEIRWVRTGPNEVGSGLLNNTDFDAAEAASY